MDTCWKCVFLHYFDTKEFMVTKTKALIRQMVMCELTSGKRTSYR